MTQAIQQATPLGTGPPTLHVHVLVGWRRLYSAETAETAEVIELERPSMTRVQFACRAVTGLRGWRGGGRSALGVRREAGGNAAPLAASSPRRRVRDV